MDTPVSLRKELSQMLCEREDEARLRSLDSLLVQGNWSRWDDLVAQDLRWNAFFNQQIPQSEFKLLLNSMENTLPSEQNMVLWKLKTGSSCKLCEEQQPPSLIHVVNVCKGALNRFKMHHESEDN